MLKSKLAIGGASLLLVGGWAATQAQEAVGTAYSEICSYFGPDRARYLPDNQPQQAAELTAEVAAQLAPLAAVARSGTASRHSAGALPAAVTGSRSDSIQTANPGLIDHYIFEKIAASRVTPAPPTTDFEFLRRVKLDLTGRIPTATEVVNFVNDTDPDKRTKLIDKLIGSPEWLDKWTIWFGDLYQNNSTNDLAARRFINGVVAFNDYVRTSLASNKPYNVMASELISSAGANSYEQGELNFLVAGVMGGGPIQDVFDKQTAVVAEKFLGISHFDCLLCHNGRGHLDSLSLWGYYTTRQQAWGLASFLSHTRTARVPTADAVNGQPYYWTLQDNVRLNRNQDYTVDYRLNTDSGNRPARGATNSTATVPPAYPFDGEGPRSGETYRQALARKITSDVQFSRAIVNYMWEYFFGVGIVSPSNQFDPMRLDPKNPPSDCPLPTSPCSLQPSHPELLEGLAQDFIANGYNLKLLMREIATSRAYQLSSRYEGTWDPSWDRLFARKNVRRLWSEEIHDAIVQSSGLPVTYTGRGWGPVNWAMQLPEPLNTPNGAVAQFLAAFLRGNRDDQQRRGDFSVSQALALMNNNIVVTRIASNGPTSLIRAAIGLPDDQAVTLLYVSILSRPPGQGELDLALANLKANREGELRALMWSLYNKVDFIYNY